MAWDKVLSNETFKQKIEKMLAENGKKLGSAISDRNVDYVRRIIAIGMVDLNWQLTYQSLVNWTTPLCMAAKMGQTEVVKIVAREEK